MFSGKRRLANDESFLFSRVYTLHGDKWDVFFFAYFAVKKGVTAKYAKTIFMPFAV